MIIRNKIKNLEDFIIENSPEEKDVETKDGEEKELSQEIDQILNNLKKLEIRLDSPTSTTQTPKIGENLEPIYENTDMYEKGKEKGEGFAKAAGVAIVILYLKRRAKKRLKKKQAAYTKYWPTKSKLELDKSYSDRFFDLKINREEFIEKELAKHKEKDDAKIKAVRQKDPDKANQLRQKSDEKMSKLTELINKKLDQKKEKRKVDIERKIEDLDIQWKRDDADTNIQSLFAKFSGNPAGGKIERLWQDWKLQFDRQTEDKMIDYERSLIDKLYGEDKDELDLKLDKLDKKSNSKEEEFKEREKKGATEKAELAKMEAEFEKEQEEKQKNKPEMAKAIAKEIEFNEAVDKFEFMLYDVEEDPSNAAKQEKLKKAWKTVKMRNNFAGGGKAAAKNLNPDATDEDIQQMIKSRSEEMEAYKKAYLNLAKKSTKEPVTQESFLKQIYTLENKSKIMKKIKLFEEFILEAKLSSKQQVAYDFYYSHEEEHEAKHVADYHTSQAEIYADPKADLVTKLDAHLANFKKQNKKYTALSKKAIKNQSKMEAEFDKLNPGMEKLKNLIKQTAMVRGKAKDPLLGEYSKKFARDVISSDTAFLSTYDDMVDSYIRDFEANKKMGEKLMDELSAKIEELG